MNRLQRVQNSLARVVCNAPYRSSSLPLRKALHWLPVEQRVQHKIAVMTYKVRLHQQPLYLREYINDHLPARSLRSTNKMLLTTVTTKTATAARAFRAAAPKIWNSLYPSQSNQPRPSTSSAACLKDTCLAMPLDDRHSHPEPLHRRLISRRIMAPLTNYIDIDI